MKRFVFVLSSLVAAMALNSFAAPAIAADMPAAQPMYTKAPPIEAWSPWEIRVRALAVLPYASGSSVNVAGVPALSSPNSGLSIGDSVVPELDITYYFTRNWAAELILGVTPHKITGTGSLNSVDVGRAWLLPPTLTLQYHFTDFGAFQPYVGVGVNYTVFFDQSAGNTPSGAVPAITSLNVKDSFGAAAQIGFDYMIDRHWGINVDAKWLYLEPSYSATAAGTIPISGTAHINPWLIGAGIAYKF
jgi:outer membrane protein